MKVHVCVDGIREKSFGFSHDAGKSNHHMAGNLGVSQADTQALARCHKSKDWYFNLIRQWRSLSSTRPPHHRPVHRLCHQAALRRG